MTLPPSHENAAVAALLDGLRAFEADAAGAAVDAGPGALGTDAPALTEAQLRVRSLADLGVVRDALERVALRQIAALDRACAWGWPADLSLTPNRPFAFGCHCHGLVNSARITIDNLRIFCS